MPLVETYNEAVWAALQSRTASESTHHYWYPGSNLSIVDWTLSFADMCMSLFGKAVPPCPLCQTVGKVQSNGWAAYPRRGCRGCHSGLLLLWSCRGLGMHDCSKASCIQMHKIQAAGGYRRH